MLIYAQEMGGDRGGRLVGRVEIRDRLLAEHCAAYPLNLAYSARANTKSRE